LTGGEIASNFPPTSNRWCARCWLAARMATIISLERRSLWGLPPDTLLRGRCYCLGPTASLLLFVPSLQPPSTSLSLHLLCFLSQHTLWLIIAFTLLTAAHRSPQVALFDAGGIAYLQTTILRRSKHHSQIIARKRQQTLEATPATRHQPTRHDQAANRS
jgi:hypothetical protein